MGPLHDFNAALRELLEQGQRPNYAQVLWQLDGVLRAEFGPDKGARLAHILRTGLRLPSPLVWPYISARLWLLNKFGVGVVERSSPPPLNQSTPIWHGGAHLPRGGPAGNAFVIGFARPLAC
jgi:hypothetical protein